jgi:hypothetical protein
VRGVRADEQFVAAVQPLESLLAARGRSVPQRFVEELDAVEAVVEERGAAALTDLAGAVVAAVPVAVAAVAILCGVVLEIGVVLVRVRCDEGLRRACRRPAGRPAPGLSPSSPLGT